MPIRNTVRALIVRGPHVPADESVVFFPTVASRDADGSWRVPIHGWIFRPAELSRLRRLAVQAVKLAVRRHVPEQAGRRVAQLKGALHLKVAEKTTVVDMPAAEFASGRQFDFHGAHIAVSPVRNMRQPPDIEYSASLNITHPGMTPDAWDDVCDLLDGATIAILDDAGKPYNQNGFGGTVGRTITTNRTISGQFQQNAPFGGQRAGPAAMLRITLPEELKDIPVPFEFKDLPLP